MLNIQTKLTPYNFTNTNNINRIKYIVIHYCGATGTAKNNVKASDKFTTLFKFIAEPIIINKQYII